MNINLNRITSANAMYTKSEQVFKNTNISSSNSQNSDQVELSRAGKMMSQILRKDDRIEEQQTHMAALQTAFSEIDISNIDTENMTDDEIRETLATFESVMGQAMQEGYKPASEMSTDELKTTINDLKGMAEQIKSGKPGYGPPPMGKGKPKVEQSTTSEDTTQTALELLQELLNDEEDENTNSSVFYQSMEAILSSLKLTH